MVFFYDDNNFRKCPQRNEQAKAYSRASDWIVGLGDSNNGVGFAINKTKIFCYAQLHTTYGGYDFPTATDVQRNGDFLYFSGTGSSTFAADVVEVFGINTNLLFLSNLIFFKF